MKKYDLPFLDEKVETIYIKTHGFGGCSDELEAADRTKNSGLLCT